MNNLFPNDFKDPENIVPKKVYPSQLNTKTISARIPVSDYVTFLKDAMDSGITLNDWLLIKIYSNSEDKSNHVFRIKRETFETLISGGKQTMDYCADLFDENDELVIDLERVIDAMDALARKQSLIDQLNKHIEVYSVASVGNVKAQLSVLIQKSFSNVKERQAFRKEIFGLLNELETD